MPTIGPIEKLVLLVVAALIVYFGLRGRAPTGVLIVLVLSPLLARALAISLGAVL